jgi:hypothetical protein
MADRVIFTPADHDRIALCRGSHNRLGFAYQMGFMRLTGRLPSQQPLEILDDLLAFVAHEVSLDATLIHDYAQRQATVSAHQEHIRLYLGFRPFGSAEQDELRRYLLNEASRLEPSLRSESPRRGLPVSPAHPDPGSFHPTAVCDRTARAQFIVDCSIPKKY